MNEIINFLLIHWILSSIFLLLLGAVIYVESKSGVKGAFKLSSQEVVQLMNHENALLVDIRDRNTYIAGHIVNAIHVLPSELSNNKKLLDYKNKPIILICSNGMQSPALTAQLLKQGFTKIYYLAGGINAWKEDNLPTVK